MTTKSTSQNAQSIDSEKTKPMCGIIMPISPIDGLTAEHWFDVKNLIDDVADQAGFASRIVSTGDESGIIQHRIIQNLHSDDIVVCDVSGKNPNVMFELGIRLAFDKPTIIIKDDKTDYSFDTAIIEHIEYPRDLRFNQIVSFKSALIGKIKATYEKSKDEGYSTFLKHFGTFKAKELKEKDGTINEVLLDTLDAIRFDINSLKRRNTNYDLKSKAYVSEDKLFPNLDKILDRLTEGPIYEFMKSAKVTPSTILNNEQLMRNLINHLLEILKVEKLQISDDYLERYLKVKLLFQSF
jgi:hypothetical protein